MNTNITGTTEHLRQTVACMEAAGPGATGSQTYREIVAELDRRGAAAAVTVTDDEIRAWLGPAVAELTADEIAEVRFHAQELHRFYPGPDDATERDRQLSDYLHTILEGKRLRRELDASNRVDVTTGTVAAFDHDQPTEVSAVAIDTDAGRERVVFVRGVSYTEADALDLADAITAACAVLADDRRRRPSVIRRSEDDVRVAAEVREDRQ